MKENPKPPQKKLRKFHFYVLPLVLPAALSIALGLKYSIVSFIVLGAVMLAYVAVGWIMLVIEGKKLQHEFDSLFDHNSTAAKTIFSDFTKPAVICTEQGQVVMRNAAFDEISTDMYLAKVFTNDELIFENHEFEKKIGDRYYIVSVTAIDRSTEHTRNLLFIYLTDITKQIEFTELYEKTKPAVAKIFVDNYDNISIENDMYSNSILNKIEEVILHITKNITHGIYRRETRSFLMVFESEYLAAFEEALPKILNDMHEIKNIDGKYISVSVGVGADDKIDSAATLASDSLEIALGRGGDQAVVKHSPESSPKFYGDGKGSSEQNFSKVHVRTFANNLRELILDSTEVYIMGHRDEDVDCIGAAFGLASFIMRELDKPVHVLYSGGLEKLISDIGTQPPDYLCKIAVTESDVADEDKDGALLIIVDTQREMMLSAPDIYHQLADNAALIDHHRRSEDAIKCAATYMESSASSASEMVTEVIQTLSEHKKPIPKFEATALFAGIAMDTKGFVFNTGKRTFEAAALLKMCGADPPSAMKLYQDDITRYEYIAQIVSNAQTYPNSIAVSVFRDTKDVSDVRAIIARAADTLVTLKGICAAIVLAKLKDDVLISARSTGSINVQLICEALGGGGHRTVAGAQLRDTDCDSALAQLLDAVNSYYGEKEKSNNESDTTD